MFYIMIGPQRSFLAPLIGSFVGALFIFSQRLTSRLLFFVVHSGLVVWSSSRRRYKTQTIDRSVLSSLWIVFARPIALQGGATGLSRLFVSLAELVPLENLVV
jgi:hypothetical protein